MRKNFALSRLFFQYILFFFLRSAFFLYLQTAFLPPPFNQFDSFISISHSFSVLLILFIFHILFHFPRVLIPYLISEFLIFLLFFLLFYSYFPSQILFVRLQPILFFLTSISTPVFIRLDLLLKSLIIFIPSNVFFLYSAYFRGFFLYFLIISYTHTRYLFYFLFVSKRHLYLSCPVLYFNCHDARRKRSSSHNQCQCICSPTYNCYRQA